MLETMLAMPDHLRDALWRVETARLERGDAAGLLACGMGGSAIGSSLARAALGDRLERPIDSVRTYQLPPTASADQLVLCSSYSGDTEETLACFEAAGELGSDRIVATTGGALEAAARAAKVPVVGLPSGMQPRAAVGYMFTVVCEVAAIAGAAPSLREELEAAATYLEGRRDALVERAKSIAASLDDAVIVIYGSGLTAPVAYRWKTQMNENAKAPAFSHELPEADHNELEGWVGAGDKLPLAAVLLREPDQGERIHRRIELTAKLVGETAKGIELVDVEGETRTARLLEAVMLGDLVSLQVAERRGVEAEPVEAIERLKDELGKP